jgi:twitching motility protein PilU
MPACEVLLNTPYISELIEKGEIEKIHEVMEKSGDSGMQSFDQSIYELYKHHQVSLQEALNNAESRNNLQIMIRLASGLSEADIASDLSLDSLAPE